MRNKPPQNKTKPRKTNLPRRGVNKRKEEGAGTHEFCAKFGEAKKKKLAGNHTFRCFEDVRVGGWGEPEILEKYLRQNRGFILIPQARAGNRERILPAWTTGKKRGGF